MAGVGLKVLVDDSFAGDVKEQFEVAKKTQL
jgi:hypothetical protein